MSFLVLGGGVKMKYYSYLCTQNWVRSQPESQKVLLNASA